MIIFDSFVFWDPSDVVSEVKDSDSPTNTIMKVGIVLDKTKREPKIVFLSKERSLIDVLSNT